MRSFTALRTTTKEISLRLYLDASRYQRRGDGAEDEAISQYGLARATGLSQVQIGNIVRGRQGITTETALRLEQTLGMSAQTWMNLQILYDFETAFMQAGRQVDKTTEQLKLRDAA